MFKSDSCIKYLYYFTLTQHGQRVQYFICLCVCVLPCYLKSIISISKQVATLKVDNLRQTVVRYKIGKFFQATMAHTACKFVKLKTRKVIIQISHKRHLNQANGTTLLETYNYWNSLTNARVRRYNRNNIVC